MANTAKYIIERMSAQDLSQILEIENVSYPSPWHKHIFELELKRPRTLQLVSKSDEKVLGYLIAWMLYDEIHILNVAVHPDFRRNGIAEQLINFTIEHFTVKGAQRVILEVRVNNAAAQKLYEKLGFKAFRIRKQYYTDTGEDALVMSLDLYKEESS